MTISRLNVRFARLLKVGACYYRSLGYSCFKIVLNSMNSMNFSACEVYGIQ